MDEFYDKTVALVRRNDVAGLRQHLAPRWARNFAADILFEISTAFWLLTPIDEDREDLYALLELHFPQEMAHWAPLLWWHPETGSRLDDVMAKKYRWGSYYWSIKPPWPIKDAPEEVLRYAYEVHGRISRYRPPPPLKFEGEYRYWYAGLFDIDPTREIALCVNNLLVAAVGYEHAPAAESVQYRAVVYFEACWDLTGEIPAEFLPYLPWRRLGLSRQELANMAANYDNRDYPSPNEVGLRYSYGPMSVLESFDLIHAPRADVWARLDAYCEFGVYGDHYHLHTMARFSSPELNRHLIAWLRYRELNFGDARDKLETGNCKYASQSPHRTAQLWSFWEEWISGGVNHAAVWYFAAVLLCDGYVAMREGDGSSVIYRFLRIMSRLPIELQVAVSRSPAFHDDHTLVWLLRLLSDPFFALDPSHS